MYHDVQSCSSAVALVAAVLLPFAVPVVLAVRAMRTRSADYFNRGDRMATPAGDAPTEARGFSCRYPVSRVPQYIV